METNFDSLNGIDDLLQLADKTAKAYKWKSPLNLPYQELFQQFCSGGLSFLHSEFGKEDALCMDFEKNANGKANIEKIVRAKGVLAAARKRLQDLVPLPNKIPPYDWKSIHAVIRVQSQSRFEAKHYADAVEAAFKEINKLVKEAYKATSGENKEFDGADLMNKAFGYERNQDCTIKRLPILRLTNRDLTTDSGFNVQDGYRNLFVGAMRGIRNPKAHANVTIDAIEAWEMLVFSSHLMRMWDQGQESMRNM